MVKAAKFPGLLIIFLVVGVLGNIERIELEMPRYALKGDDVALRCEHSVPPEQLHKVEWRKGKIYGYDKIFQYVKGRKPPFKYYPFEGATLNTSRSSEKQVFLSDLDFAASGSYFCIVSIEIPSIFTKESEVKDLTVIEPQEGDPEIKFTKNMYQLGDLFSANCSTSPARPPPHISWFINDKKVHKKYTKDVLNRKQPLAQNFLETKAASVNQLSIKVLDLHISDEGDIKLTCMATIPATVNSKEEYADVRTTTVKIEVEMTEGQMQPASVGSNSSGLKIFSVSSPCLSLVIWLSLIYLRK